MQIKPLTDFPCLFAIRQNPWLGGERDSFQYKLLEFIKSHPTHARICSISPELLEVVLDDAGNWVDVKEQHHEA